MIRAAYRGLLRGPAFRGRHRLETLLRSWLAPSVDFVDGLRMELDPQEWLQIHMLSGETLEPRTVALFHELLRPGDVCIDVGAHVGFHALTAARLVGPRGQVFALDPQPYNGEKLLRNCQLNGMSNVLVICAAAGADDSFIVLNQQKNNDKARLSLAGAGVSDVAARFEAPVVRIDTLAARHGVTGLRLLKVDVEGYEPEVLEGAGDLLDRTDHLILEVLPDTDPVRLEAMLASLAGRGFILRQIDGAAWRRGEALIEYNLWACRPSALLDAKKVH